MAKNNNSVIDIISTLLITSEPLSKELAHVILLRTNGNSVKLNEK